MSIAETSPPKQVLSGLTPTGIVLEGVSWATYERLLQGLGDRRVFVTFDSGTMEIQTMSPSYKHENDGRLLDHFVGLLCVLTSKPMQSAGSVTMRHPDLDKGLEADGCFWFEHAKRMAKETELDLTKSPAPELVIEVDIHASSIDRIAAYKKLGVREVWWIRERKLLFLTLGEDGEYDESEQSRCLPTVGRSAVEAVLRDPAQEDDTQRIKSLLAAVGVE